MPPASDDEEPLPPEQLMWVVVFVATGVLSGLLRLVNAVFGLPEWAAQFLWKPLGALSLMALVVLVRTWLRQAEE